MQINAQSIGRVEVLRISGRFDSRAAPIVRKWLDKNIADGNSEIVVNFEEANFVDSTALATLLHGMKQVKKQNGELRLCNLHQPIRIIIELTRLDRVFEIFHDEEEAINAFNVDDI